MGTAVREKIQRVLSVIPRDRASPTTAIRGIIRVLLELYLPIDFHAYSEPVTRIIPLGHIYIRSDIKDQHFRYNLNIIYKPTQRPFLKQPWLSLQLSVSIKEKQTKLNI